MWLFILLLLQISIVSGFGYKCWKFAYTTTNGYDTTNVTPDVTGTKSPIDMIASAGWLSIDSSLENF